MVDRHNFAGLAEFFRGREEVDLAYLFGSRAANRAGPSSDIDLAISLRDGDRSPES